MEHSSREVASLSGEHRLTDVELGFVKHALDAEILGLKKCMHYVDEVGDEEARDLLRRNADIHHRRIDMMISLLDATGDITKHAKLLLQNPQDQGGLHRA